MSDSTLTGNAPVRRNITRKNVITGLLLLLFVLIAPPLNQWFFSIVMKFYAALGGVRELASIGYALTLFWH